MARLSTMVISRPSDSRVNSLPSVVSRFNASIICFKGCSSDRGAPRCRGLIGSVGRGGVGAMVPISSGPIRVKGVAFGFCRPRGSFNGAGSGSLMAVLRCSRGQFLFANSVSSGERRSVIGSSGRLGYSILGITRRNDGCSSDRSFLTGTDPRATMVDISTSSATLPSCCVATLLGDIYGGICQASDSGAIVVAIRGNRVYAGAHT